MKKNWKRFFTLSRAAEGFTLVELIVVIAILAILAGVAVPAYSGYITKANKSNDQTLVSEVAHALTLYYYSNPDSATADYVILSTSGAEAGGEFAVAAMKAAFGDNWENVAALKYDGWTDHVANTIADENVANSSYVQHDTPSNMMNTVSQLTGKLSSMAQDAGRDPLTTLSTIGQMSEEQAAAVRKDIKDNYGLEYGDEGYADVVANSLVKYVMDDLGGVGSGAKEGEEANLSTLVASYATIYAWSLTNEKGATALNTMNDVINNPDSSSKDIVNIIQSTFEGVGADAEFGTYIADQGTTDIDALYSIMSAASQITNGADMKQQDLYTSTEFANKLDSYVGAVKSVSSMTEEQAAAIKGINPGELVLFLTADGNVLCEYSD